MEPGAQHSKYSATASQAIAGTVPVLSASTTRRKSSPLRFWRRSRSRTTKAPVTCSPSDISRSRRVGPASGGSGELPFSKRVSLIAPLKLEASADRTGRRDDRLGNENGPNERRPNTKERRRGRARAELPAGSARATFPSLGRQAPAALDPPRRHDGARRPRRLRRLRRLPALQR